MNTIKKMKKSIKILCLLVTLISLVITGCKKDNESVPDLAKSTLDKVEIGLNNNSIGTIGRDFHFNAEVIAATKIESISIRIEPKKEEIYTKVWRFEKEWPQYKNAKNALVHEHFNIPSDAAEGKYDFLITVKDQNGSVLEEKGEINLYMADNLPIDPQLFSLYVGTVDNTYKLVKEIYNSFNPEKADFRISKDELLTIRGAISGLKGDGKAVMVLINKKHNHKPETIDAIDYSKTIVVDVAQHIGVPASGSFSTTTDRSTTPVTLRKPVLKIGASVDNNTPTGNAISGLKTWETGKYYLGIIYKNTTHNIGMFSYIEISITY